MNGVAAKNEIVREKLARFGALAALLLLGGLALAGPYGLLAWGENIALLEKRQHHIAELRVERIKQVVVLSLYHRTGHLQHC